MTIGYIGLGKMGLAQVERLLEYGHRVVAWNRSLGPRKRAEKAGAEIALTYADMCAELRAPRLIWLMVPHGVVDDVLQDLVPHLSKGDTIIDGGNSFFEQSAVRAKELAKKGITFLDCGTSGGPSGARKGACLMVGGDENVFKKYEKIFKDLAVLDGYAHVGKAGAGHFVKMVHNGIEYGMMQAIGEGFEVLYTAERRGLDADRRGKRIKLGLDLKRIVELYNKGSVIESRLVGWLAQAYKEHGETLKGISGKVSHSGEGLWTVKTAKKLKVPVKIIEDSLKFRVQSQKKPSYTGQVVSALRNQFGGHDVTKG
ncbi:MAG: 6-phosphogluconate dehydrogenase (decarboxylating) [Candidatus Taylorbacteria bacterium CG11_big_fil_rev_8_21_14_0_20_46_11]|uniref:6-phosphogluconate dehydrogenase (Decarboxylating) n=1 Tax=Candidatus Taylorbacteria bacterium CG11_big_fil_rev_8_21_14_0_20_46_11 TaxID=1975025 RepID=A0A2H0KBM6_9BACT|nr:MAG: 6-phosphogluconate dehydrogenase (decarboxylating) [Candidatus Taylorbacteria bacterium CG11_big_fil_rev_8_21_14_0_20_46_11]